MGQLIRQSNLFAAEDWKVIYRSFRNADFRKWKRKLAYFIR